MPARELQARGVVVAKAVSGERFLRLHVLCAENGRLICLWRHSHKMGGGGPDLFDAVSLSLESSSQSGAWFLKEYHTGRPRPGLARRYRALQLATRLGDVLWRNLQHAEFFDPAAQLFDEALDAFEEFPLPQSIYLKALYRFAREEGYAVRQQWLAGLAASETERARSIILRPLAELPDNAEALAAPLTEKLERWLRGETDIIVP
ncbi:MAG: hypothetical protein ACQKBV_05335 [Puniceicoccales bacterium]